MEKDPNLDNNIQLPPGFRFHPSDEELIVHYLRNKATSCPLPASFIADIDLYKFNPWELPSKALFGEDEWFFFTPRDRKYPNGLRPNRAAGLGYWKATGTDKAIMSSSGMKSIGVKKALVFYKGRPPKGSKTDWIMHEYRLLDSMILTYKQRGSMRLDDWVLCRVRQKVNSPRSSWEDSNNNNEPESYSQQMKCNNYDDPTDHETGKNYIFNEFPMLPYILGSCKTNYNNDVLLPMGNASSSLLSYQHTQFSESSADDERLKRKLYEEQDHMMNLYYDFCPPFKKLREEDHEREIMQDIDFSKGYTSSFDHWNAILQAQDLNNLAFAGYI